MAGGVLHRAADATRDVLPESYAPQLALLVKAPPDDDAWLHEIKFDGYRIGCRIDRGTVQLLSRNGKDWTALFPSVCDAARKLSVEQAWLDGEVCVVMPDGRTSFQALQNAIGGRLSDGHIAYFVFDLLYLDGVNVGRDGLEQRKQRLLKLLGKTRRSSVLRYSDHVVGHGRAFFEHAGGLGVEGIVSKRRDAPHTAGRGSAWVKTKCIKRQELVIGGFTDPQGRRAGIGALLVGVMDERGRLVYAGKVGTGFTQASAAALRKQLAPLERREAPFATSVPSGTRKRAHWVEPTLVAEVAFSEWTGDGRIRHPSFQGLRADKPASAVIRERPDQRVRVAPSQSPPLPELATGATVHEERSTVAGISVSHPTRVVYPDSGITKLDLARFYEQIADWILPHLEGRPLTLVRCPAGIGAGCFFMKHSGSWTPAGVRRVGIQEKKKIGQYLVVDNLSALIALVQANVIEWHTWNATVDHVELPDRLVFDLDPGPDVRWPAVVDAARLLRTALHTLELESFVKTTGGHGLHVVVPLTPIADWRVGLEFAQLVAAAMVKSNPRAYTTTFSKAGREKKILIDVMRNNRLSTSVAAFSTRARPGAPVSTPLAWDELSPRLRSDHYTVRNLGQRLQRLGKDPWAAYWKCKQRLPKNAGNRLSMPDE